MDLRAYVRQDLVLERKVLPERNGRDLGKIVVDGGRAEQLIVAMPDDSPHLNLEKVFGTVAGGNAAEFDHLRHRFAQIMMVLARTEDRLQFAAVPADFADLCLAGRTRTEYEFLAIADTSEPADTAKSTRPASTLLAGAERRKAVRKLAVRDTGAIVGDLHASRGDVDGDGD